MSEKISFTLFGKFFKSYLAKHMPFQSVVCKKEDEE